MRQLGADRAFRAECGEILCEGYKLLGEAVAHGARLGTVLYCGERPDVPGGAELCETTRDVIEYVSPMRSPQNVIFSCTPPDFGGPLNASERCIVLENVQDPGNVGTVIRTANAFGIDAVALVGACADPFNPKTVRSTMGATFRQRVVQVGYDELEALTAGGMELLGAALGGGALDLRECPLSGRSVAIGSEGRGLSDRLLAMCAGRVIIPMAPECESLNAAAAAAVLMWEMRRREVE